MLSNLRKKVNFEFMNGKLGMKVSILQAAYKAITTI